MKFKWILIIVLMQVFTAEVLAMAQAIRTEGTMEVTKSFVVKGTTAKWHARHGREKSSSGWEAKNFSRQSHQ